MKITTTGKGTTLPNGDIPMAQPEDAGHPVHMAASITPDPRSSARCSPTAGLQAGLDWGPPELRPLQPHPENQSQAKDQNS
jgi:hypothetical protein